MHDEKEALGLNPVPDDEEEFNPNVIKKNKNSVSIRVQKKQG